MGGIDPYIPTQRGCGRIATWTTWSSAPGDWARIERASSRARSDAALSSMKHAILR